MSNVEAKANIAEISAFFPFDISEKQPTLPFMSMHVFAGKMPEGEWVVPDDYKGASARKNLLQVISPWIYFLDSAQVGQELVAETFSKGIISGDQDSLWDYYQFAMVYENTTGKEELKKRILSSRKALEFLLIEDVDEESETEEVEITQQDIDYAKEFIAKFNKRYLRLESFK